jgi:hypothetical protein
MGSVNHLTSLLYICMAGKSQKSRSNGRKLGELAEKEGSPSQKHKIGAFLKDKGEIESTDASLSL